MKKLLFMAAAAFAVLFVSCSQKKEKEAAPAESVNSMSEKAKKNLASMHGVISCFEKKDFSKLGDYVAENCVDHYWDRELKGLKEMKAEYEKWIGMSDNSPMKSITEMANDEYVVIWTSFEEKIKVDNNGLKKGQTFKKTDFEVGRFEDGKVVEHWTFIEPAVMMKMMGIDNKTAPTKTN